MKEEEHYCKKCGSPVCLCNWTLEQLEILLDSVLNPDKYITEEDRKRWEETDYDNIPEEELYIDDDEEDK